MMMGRENAFTCGTKGSDCVCGIWAMFEEERVGLV